MASTPVNLIPPGGLCDHVVAQVRADAIVAFKQVAQRLAPVRRKLGGRNLLSALGDLREALAGAARWCFTDQLGNGSSAGLSHLRFEVQRFFRWPDGDHGVPPRSSTNAFQRTQNRSTSGRTLLNSAWTAITSSSGGSVCASSFLARRIARSASILPRSVGRSNASLVNHAPGVPRGVYGRRRSFASGGSPSRSRSNHASCFGSNQGSADASTSGACVDAITCNSAPSRSSLPTSRNALRIDRCHLGCRWPSTSSNSRVTRRAPSSPRRSAAILCSSHAQVMRVRLFFVEDFSPYSWALLPANASLQWPFRGGRHQAGQRVPASFRQPAEPRHGAEHLRSSPRQARSLLDIRAAFWYGAVGREADLRWL